jgi:hypothetical protein
LPDIKKEFKVLLGQIMDVLSAFRNLPAGRNLLLYNAATFPPARLKVGDGGRIFLKLQAWPWLRRRGWPCMLKRRWSLLFFQVEARRNLYP